MDINNQILARYAILLLGVSEADACEMVQKDREGVREKCIDVLSSPPGDIPVLLELLADETDHIAYVAQLISQQTGEPVDYAAMVPGVE